MASSSRTEAVARLGELVLIDGSQYLVDGLLHQTVYYCRYSQQAHLAVVFGYFYPFHWVRTVRTVHQGTDEFILIGQEPWEQLLTRHLVDTTTALVSHNRLVGSVEICRTKNLLEKVFLVEWYFHDVVFTYPHEGLRSHISFGFRPIFLWAALDFCQCFLHSFLHKVRFNYYRLIYRFCPSWNVIEYSTTMASADFSRQALLHDFRKSN